MIKESPSPLIGHSSLKGSFSLIEDEARKIFCVPTQNMTTKQKGALSKYQNDISAS
jgi:hypothetical protein